MLNVTLLRPIHTRGFAPGACSRVNLHDQYTLGSIMWELAPYYGTRDGTFSSLFNLPRDIVPKYLVGLMLWSILQGGNSAPENESRP